MTDLANQIERLSAAATPGLIGVIESGIFFDRHVIVRVVKVGKVMWTVEVHSRGEWREPVSRKVAGWIAIPDGTDLLALDAELQHLSKVCSDTKKQAQVDYHKAVSDAVNAVPQIVEALRAADEAEALRARVAELSASVSEMIAAMHRYEMDVDADQPEHHRAMMSRARKALKAKP